MQRLIAAGLGSGWLPAAPGTWGSLAAMGVAWGIVSTAGVAGLIAAWLCLLPLSCWACAAVLTEVDEADPAWVVADEWLGQWLCLLIVSLQAHLSLPWMAAAFAAFRVFDIAKPWPVSWAERLEPAWWGIVADDLVAGAMAGVSLLAAGYWL